MNKGELKKWLDESDLDDSTPICDIVTGYELQSIHVHKDCIVQDIMSGKSIKETFINLNFYGGDIIIESEEVEDD